MRPKEKLKNLSLWKPKRGLRHYKILLISSGNNIVILKENSANFLRLLLHGLNKTRRKQNYGAYKQNMFFKGEAVKLLNWFSLRPIKGESEDESTCTLFLMADVDKLCMLLKTIQVFPPLYIYVRKISYVRRWKEWRAFIWSYMIRLDNTIFLRKSTS